MLGTVLAIGCFMSFYLPRAGIPVLQCLDLASFYAPVLHAIARFGCFFAGCCYGIPTTVAWAVMYTDPNSCAPLYEKLHPTQLYSVTAFLAIFVLMVIVRTTIPYRPGLLTTLYMILSGCERFIIDFWRADRCYYPFLPCAVYQAIALGVIGGGLIGLAVLACQTRKEAREYF